MFDGSHRTNKREINLAGASASSRSSRTSNLNEARRQRLARAEATAKKNGAICLQRCWRGCHARAGLAIRLAIGYEEAIFNIDNSKYDAGCSPFRELSKATSMLAFRMSPALLPFFAYRYMSDTTNNADELAEKHLRSDILNLSTIMRCHCTGDLSGIPPFTTRRIISVILILLRQSLPRPLRQSEDEQDTEKFIELLDMLLSASCSREGALRGALTKPDCIRCTNRLSDYQMSLFKSERAESSSSVTGWMIDLFLCFRNLILLKSHKDARGEKMLLKWCCRIIKFLATLNEKESHQLQASPMYPTPLVQQGIALLASILFSSNDFESIVWTIDQLTKCILDLEQHLNGPASKGSSVNSPPFSLLAHYLATVMYTLSAHPTRHSSNAHSKVSGLLPSFSSNYLSDTSLSLMDALLDTLSTRECIILSNVICHANACHKQSQQTEGSIIYAISIILHYTLQHVQDFAILASFAARGENIASWVSPKDGGGMFVTPTASMAVVAAYEGDDLSNESDEDERDSSAQISMQRPAPDISAASISTGMPSRAELQTLPKLDALYQAGILKAKKATVDHMRSDLRSQCNNVKLFMSLAESIGKGGWLQQLGDSLFSPTPLLTPPSWPDLQMQAKDAYDGALATVMTSLSGIKVGRNAASPILARLAFDEYFLHMLWTRSVSKVHLLSPQSKAMNASTITAAYEVLSAFCDIFSHHLLAINDDDFLERYHNVDYSKNGRIIGKDVVLVLKMILNDLYWIRPVVASDITISQTEPDYPLRFQRARLLLSGTKLWNSLYDRWCRIYLVVQFCAEDCWWFPHLATRGQHENNPIIHSQATTFVDHDNDDMDDSSVESVNMVPAATNDGGDALASAFRDPKMARVLSYVPQAMPFSRRVSLFNSLLESDKMLAQDETMSIRQMMMNAEDDIIAEIAGRERVTIRRDALYSDSKQSLNSLGKRLRKKIQVTFVNKLGQQEAGIDGGGVFKEFLDDLIKDAFLPATAKEVSGEMSDDDSVLKTHPDFFSVTPLQTLMVNTEFDQNDSILPHFEFLGRVLGKAIYGKSLISYSCLCEVDLVHSLSFA